VQLRAISRGGWKLAAVIAATLLSACGEDAQGPCSECSPAPPRVANVSVAAGPHNVLSAVVTVRLEHADSAVVRFGLAGGGLDSVTPAVLASTDSVELPVLGLLPATAYDVEVVAFGGADTAVSAVQSMTTGSLPPDLPTFVAGGPAPATDYLVLSTGGYGLVIDTAGRVVWYRRLDGGATLNFQVQPTGTYTTSPVTPPADDLTPWVEYDRLGNEIRRLGCVGGLRARFHELIAQPDGSYWLMCDDTRTLDLTAIGGVAAAAVTGTVVQHVGAGGELLFEWSVWDHFALTDLDSLKRTGAVVNWTHGNALDFDLDGNLLVSFRSLNEITKIDVSTGAVVWRLGGLANQFTFPFGGLPFVGQHGLRVVGPGQIQLLDNLGEAGGSRAERYQLDEVGHTASLVGFDSPNPAVTAQLGGSTQALPGSHTLVAYGNGNRVQEYDASGAVVWEIHGNPDYVFRAQRIRSLYQPGVGTPR
jgi:hypothetical protein